jgi:ribosome biogenesis protein BRX1
LASRGITARYRHLLEDLKNLIPHHKKDNKLDSKGDIQVVNEIAEMKSCNQILYLETRKHLDLYMYIGRSPLGPSAKFHVVNVHTTDELKLTGNCMLGSRPLLNFDSGFDSEPHFQVIKGLLTDVFSTPKGHPKSKPFVDRIMSFFIINNNIWIRNYQIIQKSEKGDGDTNLIEIGPRMVLIPIRIFNGSLGGATLYQNPTFISPNEERSAFKKRKGDRYTERVEHKKEHSEYVKKIQPPIDPLSGVNVFKNSK